MVSTMAPSYLVLQYKYVPDIVEKRLPFKDEHLQGAQKLAAANKLLVGGAVAEPVDSGIFIFRDTSKEEIESFAQQDPYVTNGLVTDWSVRPFWVIAGDGK